MTRSATTRRAICNKRNRLLASEIRTWSAAIPEWLAAGISAGIASRIFSIITKRTGTGIVPISIGVISATGMAATIICPGTVTFMSDVGGTSGWAARSGARLESWFQPGYYMRIDPLACKSFNFFQIDAILA